MLLFCARCHSVQVVNAARDEVQAAVAEMTGGRLADYVFVTMGGD